MMPQPSAFHACMRRPTPANGRELYGWLTPGLPASDGGCCHCRPARGAKPLGRCHAGLDPASSALPAGIQPIRSLDVCTLCIYSSSMEFTWSETKRAANLTKHGLVFVSRFGSSHGE